MLASSGDNGAFGDGYHFPYNVSNPATDPCITGVGGTSLLTTTGEQYEFESAWNEFPYYGASQFATPSDFTYDITSGNNGYVPFGGPGYYNGFGYSNTTGNGSIWGGGFGVQLLLSGKQAGTPPGPLIVGLKSPATATTATIEWTKSSNAVGYAIGLYHAGPLFENTIGYVKRPPTTSLAFTNLIPNTSYNVFIWGFNASGGSASPAHVRFTTPAAP